MRQHGSSDDSTFHVSPELNVDLARRQRGLSFPAAADSVLYQPN
jgi:hypothetical protein